MNRWLVASPDRRVCSGIWVVWFGRCLVSFSTSGTHVWVKLSHHATLVKGYLAQKTVLDALTDPKFPLGTRITSIGLIGGRNRPLMGLCIWGFDPSSPSFSQLGSAPRRGFDRRCYSSSTDDWTVKKHGTCSPIARQTFCELVGGKKEKILERLPDQECRTLP